MNHKNSDGEVIFDLRQFISDELSKAQISELRYTVSDYRLFRSYIDLRSVLEEYQTISHGKVVFKRISEGGDTLFEVYNNGRLTEATIDLDKAVEAIYNYTFDLIFCPNGDERDHVTYVHGRPTAEQFIEHYKSLYDEGVRNILLFWNGWFYQYDMPFDELNVTECKSNRPESEPPVRTRKFRTHDITLIASVIYNHQIENGDL